MIRSITEIQSNTDRVLGEIRSMMVDLCLRSGITEIDGRQLSREDSHIFFHQKDEMDSTLLCSVGEIEEKGEDHMEVDFTLGESTISLDYLGEIEEQRDGNVEEDFKSQESTFSSDYCESSPKFYSNLHSAYHQNSVRNSREMSLQDELKGISENRNVNLREVVTGNVTLKVFDRVSERGMDGNGGGSQNVIALDAFKLSDQKLERGEFQLFDKMPKRSGLKVCGQMFEKTWVEKGMELKSDENSFFGHLCGEKNLHIIIGDEEGMSSLQDPSIEKLHVKLEGLRSLGMVCGLSESNVVEKPWWLQYFDAAPKFGKLQRLKKMLDQDMTEIRRCTTHYSSRKNGKIEDDDGRLSLCLAIHNQPELPLPPPEPPPGCCQLELLVLEDKASRTI